MVEGHKDIIICLDVHSGKSLFLTGSKDNEIRLWQYSFNGQDTSLIKVTNAAVFRGHN
jgi:WD40 repeat protein